MLLGANNAVVFKEFQDIDCRPEKGLWAVTV